MSGQGTAFDLAPAVALLRAGQPERAAAALRALVLRWPYRADAYELLGEAYDALERRDHAVACHEQVARLRPRDAGAQARYAHALQSNGDHERSILIWRQVVQLDPRAGSARAQLAACLVRQGRTSEAIAQIAEALRLDPDCTAALLLAGHLRAIHGDALAARTAFERVLQRAPEMAEAHEALAGLDLDEPIAERLAAIHRLLDGGAKDPAAIALHYALGRLYARSQDFPASLRHLLAANTRQRERITRRGGFRAPDLARFGASMKAAFPSAMPIEPERLDVRRPQPIFIVGMPRSGTTLIERILAQAPSVSAGGELGKLPALAREVLGTTNVLEGNPAKLAALTADDLAILAERYRDALREAGDATRHVTDKLPANFMWVGWIQRLFPHARIVHARRDPLDNCLSCYAHHFEDSSPFMCDLEHLASYYAFHRDLMNHWRSIAGDRLLTIDYEDLVRNPGAVVERLAAHCGLPADADYLDFHASREPVRTFSRGQVRKPIYDSSIGVGLRYVSCFDPALLARFRRGLQGRA